MNTPSLQSSSAAKKSVDSHYLIQQISQFFTSLPNNYPVQTQIRFYALSHHMKVVLHYFKNPYGKA